MANHYLLWATGNDHPGFVAKVTEFLFKIRCNLEDSSMMRLGSEFAMFVIFSSEKVLGDREIAKIERQTDMNIGLKKISSRQARFTPSKKNSFIVRVHGPDKPGIVYHVTQVLARRKFNITDLSTHRTKAGKKAGYIVLLEGELPMKTAASSLISDLRTLGKKLQTRISVEPIATTSL